MIITCIAHSMFRMELESGLRIVTDPVGADSGYPVQPAPADAVLISHHHHDHDALDSVTDYRTVIDAPCRRVDVGGALVTAVPGWHDDAQGAKRGQTLLFLVEAEGLRIVHLGDLGTLPTPEQVQALKPVDVLMVPVGGWFTIDAAQAKQAAELLRARVILPMHYRTEYTQSWPITDETAFLAQYGQGDCGRQSLLRVTSGDMSEQRKVCLLVPRLS